MDLRERFDAKWVIWPATGCWLWMAHRDRNGYGRIHTGNTADGNRRMEYAHRVGYELYVGPIPDGLTLDHVKARGCVGPPCVNAPDHLEPVTHRVNVLRGKSPMAAYATVTHCPFGHPYDEVNTIWYEGRRYCRECNRRRNRDRWRRANWGTP